MSTSYRFGQRSTSGWITIAMQLLIVLLYVLGTAVYSTEGATCDPGDSAALLEFKAAFIDNGNYFSSWQDGSNCCTWSGVSCTDAGRVQGLSVPADENENAPFKNPSYAGVVGGSLGNLTALVSLFLRNVRFNGSAPESVGQLSNLTSLGLEGGSIPGGIGPMFRGPFPASYGRLANLATAYFPNAGFSGPIPSSVCNWVKVTSVNFIRNNLTGAIPDCIYRWTRATEIFFRYNSLSGPIPRTLGALTALQRLDFSNNTLTGPIPKTLRRLVNLKSLELRKNKLTGHVPSFLGSMQQLQEIELSQNSLSGKIPPELGNLPLLLTLNLADNQLVGQIPRQLGKLPNLTTLLLYGNRLTGCLPSQFGEIRLDVSHNSLSCPLPTNLGPLSGFFGNNNFFTGTIPSKLVASGGVVLSYNRLTGFGPASDLPPLPSGGPPYRIGQLELRHNIIAGPIPAWFQNLALNQLDLSQNLISGGFPSFIFSSSSFTVNISYNLITGNLPTLTYRQSAAYAVDASHNKLTGPITETFVQGLGVFLRYLDLSYNNLNGTVPADIADRVNSKPFLTYLNLQHNNFTGPVPSLP